MNILFCGDANVGDGIFLSVLSILKHTDRDADIYILTASIDGHTPIGPDFADRLQGTVREKGNGGTVRLFDITELFGSYRPEPNMDTRFTPFCMLRLFADLVPEIPDKILYLDTDVLCRAPFDDMYDTDISSVEIAGVPDRYGKWFFGNVLRHDYFNSGVLLMNMKKIRESGLLGKCREMCRTKKIFMPDQSSLNKLAVKKKIPGRYNAQKKIYKRTVFKHFTTYFRYIPKFQPVTVKPWDYDRVHRVLKIYEFDDIFEEYEKIKAKGNDKR